jgi:hypothetical protein
MAKRRGLLTLIRLAIAITITFTAFSLAGCGGNASPPTPKQLSETEVRAFADPAVENILLAMGESDYTSYTADFDEALKKSITQSIFDRVNTRRVDIVGDYVSKKFLSMKLDKDFISVTYFVEFSRDANVQLIVEFKNISGKYYIDKLSFASTKLKALGL